MGDILRPLVVAAAVSGAVAGLALWTMTPRGEATSSAEQTRAALAEQEAHALEVTRLRQAAGEARADATEARRIAGALQERVARLERAEAARAAIAGGAPSTAAAADAASTQTAAATDAAPEAAALSPEEQRTRAREGLDKLAQLGLGALQSPELARVVDALRALGAEGIELLERELASPDEDRRFTAAALAGALKDPAAIPGLEQAASEDPSMMVRRMASHGLAFGGYPEAGDSLVRILEGETRDAGVTLNAWYGLATSGRAEAYSLYARVLDQAGGDIPADFVVSTALSISDPRVMPLLRLSYDRPAVTDALRTRILRTLGRDPSGAYHGFLAEVAGDASASAALREAAERALRGE